MTWRTIQRLGLDADHLRANRQRGRSLAACSDDEIVQAVKSSRSFARVLVKLGLRPGGNQVRLRRRISELGLDTSHMKGQGWSRGETFPARLKPVEPYLVEGHLTSTDRLKKRLIRQGLKEARYEECDLTSWQGAPVPLELDHVNGRRDDNRLENLRLICPNCHAQTSTYRGRNIGNGSAVS